MRSVSGCPRRGCPATRRRHHCDSSSRQSRQDRFESPTPAESDLCRPRPPESLPSRALTTSRLPLSGSSSATCSLRRRVRCLSAPRAVASLAAYPGGESVQSSWIRQSGRLRREFCIDPTVSSECASSEARFWRRAALGARGSGSVSPALATTRVLRAVAGSRCASRAGLRALGLTRSFAGRRSCR